MRSFPTLLCALLSPLVVSCSMRADRNPKLDDAVTYSGFMTPNITEGRRTIKGRMLLEQPPRDGFIPVKITASFGRKIEAALSEKQLPHVKIDPSRIYQVELLTDILNHDNVSNRVLRVSLDDRVIFDASLCPVHKVVMARDIEDMKSACAYPGSFYTLQEKSFPNDGNIYAACDSGFRYPIWKCPECNRKYHQWTRRHGVDESM